MAGAGPTPLHALLSQVLVAFTVDLDNQFELEMIDSGYPGAHLSLVLWSNLMRFLPAADGQTLSVRELAQECLAANEQIKLPLGCLERWRIVILREEGGKRPGWGSGRGIRGDWPVRLTPAGHKAVEFWPKLLAQTERQWKQRFGADFHHLQAALQAITHQIPFELPQGLPGGLADVHAFPPRAEGRADRRPFPALLSQALLLFRIDFEQHMPTPLPLCANSIRVLGDEPMSESEMVRLTGCSPETAGLGWQLKPFVVVQRGGIRLSETGIRVQHKYQRLVWEIEENWKERFGADAVSDLRVALDAIMNRQEDLAAVLTPPPDVARSGVETPSLGRRTPGPAAQKRVRELVKQTERFIQDPAATLPHFPLWDMNRGFGP